MAYEGGQQQHATDEYELALRVELDRRVGEIASYPDDAFGRMGRGDLIAIALTCLVGPALLVWLCR